MGKAGEALKDLTSDSGFDFAALTRNRERLESMKEENWTGLHEILQVPTHVPKLAPALRDPPQTLINTFENNIRAPPHESLFGPTPRVVTTPLRDEPVRVGGFYVEDDIARQWREILNGMALKAHQAQRRGDVAVAEDHPLQAARPEINNVAHELLQLTKMANQMMQRWGQNLQTSEKAIPSDSPSNDTAPSFSAKPAGDQFVITAHSAAGEIASMQIPREEAPLESQPVASIHDRDPLAENREEAMSEMASLYSALDDPPRSQLC